MNTIRLTGHYPKKNDAEQRESRTERALIRWFVGSILSSPVLGLLAHESTDPDWQNVFQALMTVSLLPAAVVAFVFIVLAIDSIGRES